MGHSSKHPPRCMRCGAPAGRFAALRPITRLPAKHRVGPRHKHASHDTRRREPFGFVHTDASYCARRMPNARRNPFDSTEWGNA